jgi:hypothetical protein
MKTVLVVVRSPAERDAIRDAFSRHRRVAVVSALTALSAAQSLVDRPVSVMIAASELSAFEVNDLIELLARVRPGLPLIVLRKRTDEVPVHWARPGVGVMWTPLAKGLLARTVETVIGLTSLAK